MNVNTLHTDRSFGEDSSVYVGMYLGGTFLNVVFCLWVYVWCPRRPEEGVQPLELDDYKHLVSTKSPAGALQPISFQRNEVRSHPTSEDWI